MGHDLARLRAEVARLLERFTAAGASEVEPPALLSAETLLDLYGEDIRTRAYTTLDPVEGERMLRPDFTVPVVEMHVAAGQEPARYAYAGPVWRTQESTSLRPTEYLQVGYELFDRGAPEQADAEVFALIAGAVAGQGLSVATGDMGVIRAAVASLTLSDRRRAALLRHIWRPARFTKLLERFSAPAATLSDRRATALAAGLDQVLGDIPLNGVRQASEITERLNWLAEEAQEPPLPVEQAAALREVLNIAVPLAELPEALHSLLDVLPELSTAAAQVAARNAALAERGIDPQTLPFEARFGRTTLEYYDGFVFGLFDPNRSDLPPIATGGRYDALTSALSGGKGIPAVGGIIRPEALLARAL
ncbi:MAG: ATP phosphoribosyltransferase regulatory subunit [Pseudomonadota bacterium]